MKKIFFAIYSLEIGGVEKSLLGLLSQIPLDKYEVHLGVINCRGDLIQFLPKEICLHVISVYNVNWRLLNDPPRKSIINCLKRGLVLKASILSIHSIISKVTGTRTGLFQYLLKNEPVFPIEFDLAISYSGPSQMLDYYVCEKVKAKTKCSWIHFDISKLSVDKGMVSILYQYFDKIFIVSEEGKEIFDSIFPQFKSKTEVFYNVISPLQIVKLSELGKSFEDPTASKRLLTVGRVSPEKGQYNAIESLKILIDKGYDVHWYFVGDGKDKERCRKLVGEYSLEERVSFLGTRTNPYPFMKDCDVYVQPSRHEGYCITLAEALCFYSPIVATDFTGAREQLDVRENGIVVGMSPLDIAEGIERALKMKKVSERTIRTQSDINKVLSLI